MLDKLLVANKRSRLVWISSRMKVVSGWLSESEVLGVDNANQPMYNLSKREILVITTWAVLDLTALGVLISWVIS